MRFDTDRFKLRARRIILLLVVMVSGTLAMAPGAALAACVNTTGSNWQCSGLNTVQQTILDDNAAVTTISGFGVTATALTDEGLSIVGNGALSYIDTHNSTLTGAVNGGGLYMEATGNAGGVGGAITISTGGAITGDRGGIRAHNAGSGSIAIGATGKVTGNSGWNGIETINSAGSRNLTIVSGDVTGSQHGITARNEGTGFTQVTANGNVLAGQAAVWAVTAASTTADPATGNSLAITIRNVAGIRGIDAENNGSGAAYIEARGVVVGSDWGILALNGANATDLTIKSGAIVSDNGIGIQAANLGTGKTAISATGTVFGNNYGILSSSVADLAINVVDVASYGIAISAGNTGTGGVAINSTGTIVGNSSAIYAETAANGSDIAINVVDAAGGVQGIVVNNTGKGATSIVSTGRILAGSIGIVAVNASATTTGLTINVADVTATDIGITAANTGDGIARIVVNGTVEGTTTAGIVAGGPLASSGFTEVVNRGVVQGGSAGVYFDTAATLGARLHNTVSGTVRNVSDLPTDVAVGFNGLPTAPATLTNDGRIIGTVVVAGAAAQFTNNGIWNSAGGSSDFGGNAAGLLLNGTTGTLIAGANAGAAEIAMLDNLPQFTNRGLVTMVDTGAGDILQTSGNAAFTAGSTLAVDFGGTADLFHAVGTVDLGNAKLEAKPTGAITVGERYKVVTADGGLTGQFSGVSGGVFLVFEDTYDANNAWLEFLRYRPFIDIGLTPNQIEVGRALDTMPPAGPLYDALLEITDEATARHAYDQLSGEIYASAQGVLVLDSRFLRDAVNARVRAAFGAVGASPTPVLAYGGTAPRTGATAAIGDATAPADIGAFTGWGSVFGTWGHANSDGNVSALDRAAGGFSTGIDGLVTPEVRLGIMGGYSHSGFDVIGRASSGSSNAYHLGLYGGAQWGDVAFRAGAAYTWNDINVRRTVTLPGLVDNLSASYGAGVVQLFGDIGYTIDMGDTRLEPFLNLAHVNLHSNGFTEQGGAGALTVAGSVKNVTFATLGLRAEHNVVLGTLEGTGRGMVGWRQALGDTTPTGTHALPLGDAFTAAGSPIAGGTAVVEAGFDLDFTPAATFGLSYNGQFSGSAQDHGFKANLSVRF